ncbi:RNA-guided endonuclease InsQ/TnpB family protein [Methylobacterium frigidaeris]|uniref:Transposase n=1 Tax=Methylobacterium frigidaeris TaxID=2038277 RepID=A0AA37HG28_9HYPH|nr:RNA-guided endonuclease TnpB family protein [Methylobacterium frigidaeris]GJD65208.1 hypothetical protein MPEAHAMD_5395 [Methylobacterium frigidaeris]
MLISRGFRFRIYPSAEQAAAFQIFSGVVRLIYNIALEQRRDHYRNYLRSRGKCINFASQCQELTALRAEVPWIKAVPVNTQQQALRDLDQAYTNFFAGKAGYPSPRRKGANDTFRFPAIHCGSLRRINAKWSTIRLPKLGDIRVRTHRPLEGRALSITISAKAGKWYAAFGCEIDRPPLAGSDKPAVGIDRGVVKTLALSTGGTLSLDRERLKILDRRARKAQRALSRCQRGSQRRGKARARFAKVKAQAAAYRKDWLHKASHEIAERFGTVVLERLSITAMTRSAQGTVEAPGRNVLQKAGLNRAILDQGWRAFATAIAYKLAERGGNLLTVDPRRTSQTCAACGAVDPASRRSQSLFACTACGHEANADHNAARVILHRGQSAGVERGDGPAVKREAKGRKARKTSCSDEAQLSSVRSGGPTEQDGGSRACGEASIETGEKAVAVKSHAQLMPLTKAHSYRRAFDGRG